MKPFALVLGVALAVFAPARAHGETLTLDQALRLARVTSPQIAESRADIEGSRAAVSFAKAGYLPEANLAAVETAGFGGSTTGALGVRGIMGSPNTQHFGAGVEASWVLYDFGRTSARVEASLAGVDSAHARRALSERSAALEVVEGFGEVLSAEEDQRAAGAAIELRARDAAIARALAAAGIRPDLDALLVEARAQEATAALENARAHVAAARIRLGELLGRPILVETALKLPEPEQPEIERALTLSRPAPDPLHDMARAERARADALQNAAAREHLPKLVVAGSAGYAHRDSPNQPGYWAAGAAVVVPLLSFVREQARADEAGAGARAAAARASQADVMLNTELGREASALRALQASRRAADASVIAAKSALDAAEARYQAGQLAFSDVDAATDAFLRVESARRRLGIEAALSLARLRTWSGATGKRGIVQP